MKERPLEQEVDTLADQIRGGRERLRRRMVGREDGRRLPHEERRRSPREPGAKAWKRPPTSQPSAG